MMNEDQYLMESVEEIERLETKTMYSAAKKQGEWCGLKSGMRVLDAGCGSGKVTSILAELIQPGGEILGIDASEARIEFARKKYGSIPGVSFKVHNLLNPPRDLGQFDIIWVRFVLEYFRAESFDIVKNLTECLKPGGIFCSLDLDHNCLNHFQMPIIMEETLNKIMRVLQEKYNFDPYVGRKLYSFLHDLGYDDIQLDLVAHHLIYGNIRSEDLLNWTQKIEIISKRANEAFSDYPGGSRAFHAEFLKFFQDPRRFTYTPLILCKGKRSFK